MGPPPRWSVVLALVLPCGLPTAGLGQTGTVVPLVQEITEEPDGRIRVVFGYVNTGTAIRTIQYSINNFFIPDPSVRSVAPQNFLVGQHDRVFETHMAVGEDSVVWRLLGWDAVARRVSAVAHVPVDTGETLLRVHRDGEDVLVVTAHSTVLRAPGGVTFFSDAARTTGVRVAAGSGSWSALSDRASKVGFAVVSGEAVLNGLRSLPIYTWSYIAQGPDVRHMGPTAQHFRAVFGLGEDDGTISSVDADGVALAAVQALEVRTRALAEELRAIRAAVDQGAPVLCGVWAAPTAGYIEPPHTEPAVARVGGWAASSVPGPDPLLLVSHGGEEVLRVDNQVVLLTAPGGFGVASAVPHRTAPALQPGSGAWSMSSDRRDKQALEPVAGEPLLAGIASLEIGTWRYHGAPGVLHLGPTAQGFRQAFGLGESDTSISMVDADGLALAGAQAVLARTDVLAAELTALRTAACGRAASDQLIRRP